MHMRRATMNDADFLLDIRNDELTRAMSRTHEPVARETHMAWLTARLGREAPNLYIAEVDGAPVRTIRIDADRSLSYAVSPASRGKRYATDMLRWARDKFGILTAEIYADNIPSLRAATKAGHRVVTMKRRPSDVSCRPRMQSTSM